MTVSVIACGEAETKTMRLTASEWWEPMDIRIKDIVAIRRIGILDENDEGYGFIKGHETICYLPYGTFVVTLWQRQKP